MSNNLPDIYTQAIIPAAINSFWDIEKVADYAPKAIIVLSCPFEKGTEEEQLLLKMLAACKLQLDDYTLIQLKEDEFLAWHLLKEKTKATKILLFGILPAQLGIAALMQLHAVNNFDGAKWLPTAALDKIETTKGLKQHLWSEALKPLFEL